MSFKLFLLTSLYVVVAVFAETWIKGIPQRKAVTADEKRKEIAGVRIIGGEEAVPNEFPWVVEIRRRNEHFCAGSILSPDWIITSAQCIKSMKEELVIVAGDHDNAIYEGHEQRRAIDRIVIHPDYNQLTFENDVALLKLAVPLQFNDFVGSISYPNPEFQPEENQVVVAGWGSAEEEGTTEITKLQKVTVPLISDVECQNTFSAMGIQIFPSMICAGENGKDSCNGDAGGPMMCRIGDRKILCGQVSWGIGCGRGFPGVYTRVQSYSSFIAAVINETFLI